MSDEFDLENSDLDFLLELHGAERGLNRYFSIKEELEELLGREVDLVMPSKITNPFLKKSIYSRLKKCYESYSKNCIYNAVRACSYVISFLRACH